MEEVEAEAAPKTAAAGPELGFWLAARRRLTPDDPFFAAGDLERELLAKHVRLFIVFPFPRPLQAETTNASVRRAWRDSCSSGPFGVEFEANPGRASRF